MTDRHVREAATPMKDGQPTAAIDADEILADCSCGGTYSVRAGGPDEYQRLEVERKRHIAETQGGGQ